MESLNYLSAWASRHQRRAVPLIIMLELVNALIGITVGSGLLAEYPPGVLTAWLAGVVAMHVSVKRYAHIRLVDQVSKARFVFQKQTFFVLFSLNLLAYTFAGGVMGRIVNHPEAAISLYGSFTVTTANGAASDETRLSFREQMHQKMLKRKQTSRDNTGRRLGYVGLFILGLGLAFAGAYVACGLACGGYGFWAVMVLLLSTGILAGGIYFLGRAIDKNMKAFKDMTRDERKREGRRYLWTLLGTAVGMVLLALIPNI